MIKLNKDQILTLIPLHKGHVSQELEYAYRDAGPFGSLDIKVYADNPDNPEILLFIGGFAGTGLYGNASNNEHDQEIKELISSCFNDTAEIWLHLYSPEWESKLDTLFNGLITGKHYRIIHRLNKEKFKNHIDWREKVPNTYSLQKFDTSSQNFINKQGWQDFWHKESDRFGWFLLKEDEIISECTSVWVEKTGIETGCVEIGIETNESYRRKGFAFLTSVALIDDCLSRNLIPVWCCWNFREGSKELAEKLGFEIIENRRVIVLCNNQQ